MEPKSLEQLILDLWSSKPLWDPVLWYWIHSLLTLKTRISWLFSSRLSPNVVHQDTTTEMVVWGIEWIVFFGFWAFCMSGMDWKIKLYKREESYFTLIKLSWTRFFLHSDSRILIVLLLLSCLFRIVGCKKWRESHIWTLHWDSTMVELSLSCFNLSDFLCRFRCFPSVRAAFTRSNVYWSMDKIKLLQKQK